ncbi:acyltransferase family protein [Flavobacterium hungaricum]|uniref:Acyltransferase n=1 Tax=Flavobacterium hungaricum TaxID=2082725 RepID=A0ABR9TLS5_9FLAO|nr:acyltransferase [Flavobacterium hungaricum]MBE8726314.1 acyltransferase [Flavobacterium hungaricum]
MDRKNGIDFFRLIGALAVMCIHASFGSLSNEYVYTLRLFSRWAVPFFFLASGFFLGPKIEHNTLDFKRIQKNISLLISIIVVSFVIYLPICFKTKSMPKNIVDIFIGVQPHLWFLGSLLTGYIVIWYLYFIKKSWILPYLSAGILIGALFTDSYDQFIHKNLGFFSIRFLLSIPFMYIGIMVSKKQPFKISNTLLIGLILLGFIIQYFETEVFLNLFDYPKIKHQFLFGTIIYSISLFILASKINLPENRFSEWGRKYSLFIYLYHPLIYFIMLQSLNKIIPDYSNFIMMFSPIIGFIFLIILAVNLEKYLPKLSNILNGNL